MPRLDAPGKTIGAQCTRRSRTVLDEVHRSTRDACRYTVPAARTCPGDR
ncbi:hypothetical protein ABZY06_15005 [Streptomyces sp. NPDC006540]